MTSVIHRLGLVLAIAGAFTILLTLTSETGRAQPASLSQEEPPSEGGWCVLTFENLFELPANGCDGWELEWDAMGRSKKCSGPCDYTMSITATNTTTGSSFEPESMGDLDCGSFEEISVQCINGTQGPSWFTIRAKCSECGPIPK